MQINFKRLSEYAIVPSRADEGSAGWDLSIPCEPNTEFVLKPGERILVKLGFSAEILRPSFPCEWWVPDGFQVEIRPRSGNALKKGLTILNTPGTIDESYRGEWGVILYNAGSQPIEFHPSDKIAQAVLMPYYKQTWQEVNNLSETDRGEGGFGSTGR